MQLNQILPNLQTGGLSTSGFLFGAGTSVEAGYPMMQALTRQVVDGLSSSEREAFDEVMHSSNIDYDEKTGNPNIENIADKVISHAISTNMERFYSLELRLRSLITESILSVSSPKIDLHVNFLESLKRRAYGQPASIHILTTNYDLLFELAGAEAGVAVETGFIGSVERFFDPQRFTMTYGTRSQQNHFTEYSALTVRLIKLHGSVSWTARDGRFFERHPSAIGSDNRVMILPRRRKVMDTLHPPHDALFTAARSALGRDCKYLVSCGFSFGDDHINDNLLVPAVASGKVRLFALCEKETDGMKAIKGAGAFSAGFSHGGISQGTAHSDGTDLWKFGNFVKIFE